MLGICVFYVIFDDDFFGVGNFSEFKKFSEMIRFYSVILSFRMRFFGFKLEGLLV